MRLLPTSYRASCPTNGIQSLQGVEDDVVMERDVVTVRVQVGLA